MKNSGKNIELASFDSIFSTEETRQGGNQRIEQLPLSDLVPFKDHPFRVVDDDRMKETVESIREYGVLVPIIVRPMDDGTFEIVSGHRRKRACELAGVEEIPAIVRELDDDEATIIMVDSNLQRENILPSERAKAYQMKLDLQENDTMAHSRLDSLMSLLTKQAGVTEELKARDQMKWVGTMNALKNQAEEMILTELIYA